MIDVLLDIGNVLHILSMILLLVKFWTTRDCAGISGKTQFLYALLYTARYANVFDIDSPDIFVFMKLMYLIVNYCTILSIFVFFRKTYQKQHDSCRIDLLVILSFVVAMFINYTLEISEILWTFSIYLEALVMIPQFKFIERANYIHKHVHYYLLALFGYKISYTLYWTCSLIEEYRYDPFTMASAIVQLILYIDFFMRTVPKLSTKEEVEKSEAIKNNAVDAENGVTKKGHFGFNINTIVLSPANISATDNNKETPAKIDNKTVINANENIEKPEKF